MRAMRRAAAFVCLSSLSIAARAAEPVIEFYNALLNHYFITISSIEAAGIDRGAAGPGWHRTARVFGVPLFETGFPRFEVYGASRQLTVGYRGATAVIDSIANLLGPSHVPTQGAHEGSAS